MDIIYKCIVGSTLHGLKIPTSDIDIRFVYMEDLKDVLSPFRSTRFKIGEEEESEGWSFLHFCNLAAKCNPIVLEVLWSNLHLSSEVFDLFRDNKKCFLDSIKIREAHIEYAKCQIGRYLNYPEKNSNCWKEESWLRRVPKATVAGYRVLDQAKQLLYNKTFKPQVEGSLIETLMEIKTTPVEAINQTWLSEHKEKLENEIQRIDNITSSFTQNLDTIERLILKSYTDLSLSKGLYGGCEELK